MMEALALFVLIGLLLPCASLFGAYCLGRLIEWLKDD